MPGPIPTQRTASETVVHRHTWELAERIYGYDRHACACGERRFVPREQTRMPVRPVHRHNWRNGGICPCGDDRFASMYRENAPQAAPAAATAPRSPSGNHRHVWMVERLSGGDLKRCTCGVSRFERLDARQMELFDDLETQ